MKKNYNFLIKKEAKAFDNQARKRFLNGLVPDVRNLGKNKFFYNNPYREQEIYDIQWGPRIKDVIRCLKSVKAKNVLEIGCGAGHLALEIARNNFNTVGVDLSPTSIKIAKNYKRKIEKKEGNLKLKYQVMDINKEKIDFRFDAIIFFRSLHHIPFPKKLFKKINLMTRKKSSLIICEPVRKNFSDLSSIFAAVLRYSLETWEPYKKKFPKKYQKNTIKKMISNINSEYRYITSFKKKVQSPFDNSIDDHRTIIGLLKHNYSIKEIKFYDAFIDKLIGGLRGNKRLVIAKFLKEFDNYLIENNILNGNTLFLHTIKK